MSGLLSRRAMLQYGIAATSGLVTKPTSATTSTRVQQSVRMTTPLGDIIVHADVNRAPVSAGNFLQYVDRGLLAGAAFYRSVHPENDANPVKISVVQGGISDPSQSLPPIAHETTKQTGLRHMDGTISVARREPGTGTAGAFFICVGDQPALDFGGKRNPDGFGFAAFGRVSSGMEVVRAIWMLPTEGSDGSMGAQTIASPVQIISARRER